VAKLEAESFMKEMDRESLENTAEDRSEFQIEASPQAAIVASHEPRWLRAGNEEDEHRAENAEDSFADGIKDSLAPSETGYGGSAMSGDDDMSLISPRSPAPIEPLVTMKSLYRDPLYHPGVVSLFLNRANPWMKRPRKPLALDLWDLSTEKSSEAPPNCSNGCGPR
jgi:hypothetical protein